METNNLLKVRSKRETPVEPTFSIGVCAQTELQTEPTYEVRTLSSVDLLVYEHLKQVFLWLLLLALSLV